MLFFKRILNFRRDALAKLRDKRKTVRYPVGPGFPLKATVNLVGRDVLGRTGGPREAGVDWSGRLANLSTNGVLLQLPPAASSMRDEKSELKLSLENHQVVIPCTVAHFRTSSSNSLCGLALRFGDFTVQKAYLQLAEAVCMGASFVSIEPTGLMRNPPGLAGEYFRADNKALLTAWRRTKSGELDSYELVVGEHCVRGETASTSLQVYARPKGGNREKAALAPAVDDEVRRLFRWVLPNLSKAVPADLRDLMERGGKVPTNPPAPAVLAAPPPAPGRASTPPSASAQWQAPKPVKKGPAGVSFPPAGGSVLSLSPRPPGPA